MKRDLRRIEATLHQLSQKSPALATVSVSHTPQTIAAPKEPTLTASTRPVSFDLQAKTSKLTVADPKPASDAQPAPAKPEAKSLAVSVQTSSTDSSSSLSSSNCKESLKLPKFKMPSFTSHRNGANPALASSLLKELLTVAEGWQSELMKVLSDIQALYVEGPIVDGWLESYSRKLDSNSAVLRHAEPDRLMNYVEEIFASDAANGTPDAQQPGYVLCGLNADGQVWSTPCPPEQLPSVSLAIARHQKLRQLLSRKQYLENRLNQLSESLVVMHSQLKDEH